MCLFQLGYFCFFFFFWGGFHRCFDNVSAGTGLGIHTHTHTERGLITGEHTRTHMSLVFLYSVSFAAWYRRSIFWLTEQQFYWAWVLPHRISSVRIGPTAHAMGHLINLWIYNPRIILPISTIYYQILWAFIYVYIQVESTLQTRAQAQAKAKVLFDSVRR